MTTSLLHLPPELVCRVFVALCDDPRGFVRLLNTSNLTRNIFDNHWEYHCFEQCVRQARSLLRVGPDRPMYLRCTKSKKVFEVGIGHDVVATRERTLTPIMDIGVVGSLRFNLWAAHVTVNGSPMPGQRTIQGRRYANLKPLAASTLIMIVKVGGFAVPLCSAHEAITTFVNQLDRLPTYAFDEKGLRGMIPRPRCS